MKNKIILPLVAFVFAFAAVLANNTHNVTSVVAYPFGQTSCDTSLGTCNEMGSTQCETSTGVELYKKVGNTCSTILNGTFN